MEVPDKDKQVNWRVSTDLDRDVIEEKHFSSQMPRSTFL